MKNDHVSLIGRVLSALARPAVQLNTGPPATRSGLPVLSRARRARPITPELVNQLRDDVQL